MSWDEKSKTVTIKQLGSTESALVTITIDFAKGTTAVNGKVIELDTARSISAEHPICRSASSASRLARK